MKSKKTNKSTRPIRIETPAFTRKDRVVDGISLDHQPAVTKEKQLDSLPKRVLSRQFAFVKSSALRLAKERELVQFIGIGLVIFVVALFGAFVLHVWNTKNEVQLHFVEGYDLLEEVELALLEQRFSDARQFVDQVQTHFLQIQSSLGALHFASSSLLAVDGTIRTADTLVNTSVTLTDLLRDGILLGERMITFVEDMQHLSPEEQRQKYQSGTEFLAYQFAQLRDIQERLRKIMQDLESSDLGMFPASMQERIALLLVQLRTGEAYLTKVLHIESEVYSALGGFFPKRYVILFQNADEMRPTGGFLGSMMFVTVHNGWIVEQEFTDVYDIAGQVDVGIMAPPGLDTLTNRFGLQDANYFPEFGLSAENMLWFFDKGGSASVDGIFAINTTVVEDVLRILGPVQFPVQGTEIEVTAENFTTVLSLLVEAKVESASPKVFLKEFIDVFQGRVKDLEPKQILSLLDKHVEQRNILGYDRDTKVQALLTEYGMDGKLYTPGEGEDFVRIVPTSISGNKSDKYIRQEVVHRTEIGEDGSLLVHLEIKRTHEWNAERRQMVEALARQLGVTLTPMLREILGAGINKNYTRVYAPRGAHLVRAQEGDSAMAIDAFVEDAYSVFAFVQQTEVGTSSTISLVYTLPFTVQGNEYRFSAEKSSGDRAYRIQKEVLVDEEIVLWDEQQETYTDGRFMRSDMLVDVLHYVITLR